MKKIILITTALMMLGGCASWHNPDISDPAKEKEVFKRDSEFCDKLDNQNVPVGAQTDGEPPEPTTYEAEFSENYTYESTFEKCMKERGWIKK
ncbi:membrane lipoprotein lipid attachment site-containing protein [Maridesulfovibrio sp.]|uniref:membrane lipoprotein lipid attachment site-containing protein n=1 Tax=Maridesulfovibrio sp. TaxID=2795000 RepID=UPI0029F5193A|nr:membrane lipoprotein lipid attachment site-containing protein [Maridesulfovibrio sp.]